jgi:hypothetical protein
MKEKMIRDKSENDRDKKLKCIKTEIQIKPKPYLHDLTPENRTFVCNFQVQFHSRRKKENIKYRVVSCARVL